MVLVRENQPLFSRSLPCPDCGLPNGKLPYLCTQYYHSMDIPNSIIDLTAHLTPLPGSDMKKSREKNFKIRADYTQLQNHYTHNEHHLLVHFSLGLSQNRDRSKGYRRGRK